jgi:hypothetical protein
MFALHLQTPMARHRFELENIKDGSSWFLEGWYTLYVYGNDATCMQAQLPKPTQVSLTLSTIVRLWIVHTARFFVVTIRLRSRTQCWRQHFCYCVVHRHVSRPISRTYCGSRSPNSTLVITFTWINALNAMASLASIN